MLMSLMRQTSRDGMEKKPTGIRDIGESSEQMRYPNNIQDIIKGGNERRTDNDMMDSHAGDSIIVTFDDEVG